MWGRDEEKEEGKDGVGVSFLPAGACPQVNLREGDGKY